MSTSCATTAEEKRSFNSPFAVAEVGITGSFVEDLLVRLKVQGSDQCFLLQTARAVLGPGGKGRTGKKREEMTSQSLQITTFSQQLQTRKTSHYVGMERERRREEEKRRRDSRRGDMPISGVCALQWGSLNITCVDIFFASLHKEVTVRFRDEIRLCKVNVWGEKLRHFI